jgi:hypothetical protein
MDIGSIFIWLLGVCTVWFGAYHSAAYYRKKCVGLVNAINNSNVCSGSGSGSGSGSISGIGDISAVDDTTSSRRLLSTGSSSLSLECGASATDEGICMVSMDGEEEHHLDGGGGGSNGTVNVALGGGGGGEDHGAQSLHQDQEQEQEEPQVLELGVKHALMFIVMASGGSALNDTQHSALNDTEH